MEYAWTFFLSCTQVEVAECALSIAHRQIMQVRSEDLLLSGTW